ncbi:MAG: hypothetical protein PW788_12920 [Micavibrio sp.]|nr:hypothetical protein [Micavibrio sp.]
MSQRFYLVFATFIFGIALLATPAPAADTAVNQSMQKQEVQRISEPDVRPAHLQEPASPSEHEAEEAPHTDLIATITPDAKLQKGKPAKLVLHLKDAEGKPVASDQLELRHTQRIHLLVVDQSLKDYHHLHPKAGKVAGDYEFSFTPATAHNYRVFADVQKTGGNAEMVPALLNGAAPCKKKCIPQDIAADATEAGITAHITFDQPAYKVGTPVHGEVTLQDKNGAPLKDLEPVMGAYGHIVGFYDDFNTTAHMHPLGAEPKKADDRGASPLTFMLHPARAGYLKYYVQVRRGDKDVFLPFGLMVGE